MLKFERLGGITAELSAALLKSIVLPGALAHRLKGADQDAKKPAMREVMLPVSAPAGALVLAGSSGVPDDAVVAALHQAGSRNIDVLVLAVGTGSGPLATAVAHRFTRFGVKSCEIWEPVTRQEAEDQSRADRLEGYPVVVLVAEEALRCRDELAGTPLHHALRAGYAQGRVVVGAGAGAAALSERMLLSDGPDPVMAEGLGLFGRVLLATQFTQRQRFSLLLHQVSRLAGSAYFGIGLDEDASMVIKDGEMRVLGEGGVTVVDARDGSPYPDDTLDNPEAVAPMDGGCCGLKVHLLVPGYGLNLKTRRPLGPGQDLAGAQAAGN